MNACDQSADIFLVRHGQSEINVDRPVPRYEDARLTEVGREQARLLTRTWLDRPASVTSSPFMASRETAALLQREKDAAHYVDNTLSEFRYLDPAFADGSTRSERQARSRAYWEREDPYFCDGGSAESFSDLVERIKTVLAVPAEHDVIMLTHGMVIAAALLLVRWSNAPLHELMSRFTDDLRVNGVVSNCTVIRIPRRRLLRRS